MHVLAVCLYVLHYEMLSKYSGKEAEVCCYSLIRKWRSDFLGYISLIVMRIPVSSTSPKSGLITVPNTFIEGDRLM